MSDDPISERDGPTLEEMARGLETWRASVKPLVRYGHVGDPAATPDLSALRRAIRSPYGEAPVSYGGIVITHCPHGLDLRIHPRCFLCKPLNDGRVVTTDIDLFREVAAAYHDVAITLDTEPLHPATSWLYCTDPLCAKVRETLVRMHLELLVFPIGTST